MQQKLHFQASKASIKYARALTTACNIANIGLSSLRTLHLSVRTRLAGGAGPLIAVERLLKARERKARREEERAAAADARMQAMRANAAAKQAKREAERKKRRESRLDAAVVAAATAAAAAASGADSLIPTKESSVNTLKTSNLKNVLAGSDTLDSGAGDGGDMTARVNARKDSKNAADGNDDDDSGDSGDESDNGTTGDGGDEALVDVVGAECDYYEEDKEDMEVIHQYESASALFSTTSSTSSAMVQATPLAYARALFNRRDALFEAHVTDLAIALGVPPIKALTLYNSHISEDFDFLTPRLSVSTRSSPQGLLVEIAFVDPDVCELVYTYRICVAGLSLNLFPIASSIAPLPLPPPTPSQLHQQQQGGGDRPSPSITGSSSSSSSSYSSSSLTSLTPALLEPSSSHNVSTTPLPPIPPSQPSHSNHNHSHSTSSSSSSSSSTPPATPVLASQNEGLMLGGLPTFGTMKRKPAGSGSGSTLSVTTRSQPAAPPDVEVRIARLTIGGSGLPLARIGRFVAMYFNYYKGSKLPSEGGDNEDDDNGDGEGADRERKTSSSRSNTAVTTDVVDNISARRTPKSQGAVTASDVDVTSPSIAGLSVVSDDGSGNGSGKSVTDRDSITTPSAEGDSSTSPIILTRKAGMTIPSEAEDPTGPVTAALADVVFKYLASPDHALTLTNNITVDLRRALSSRPLPPPPPLPSFTLSPPSLDPGSLPTAASATIPPKRPDDVAVPNWVPVTAYPWLPVTEDNEVVLTISHTRAQGVAAMAGPSHEVTPLSSVALVATSSSNSSFSSNGHSSGHGNGFGGNHRGGSSMMSTSYQSDADANNQHASENGSAAYDTASVPPPHPACLTLSIRLTLYGIIKDSNLLAALSSQLKRLSDKDNADKAAAASASD